MVLLGVSSHAVCVRDDASSGSKTMAVELQAVGAEARMGVTVGILDVRMEILPKPDMGTTIPQVLTAAVTCAAFLCARLNLACSRRKSGNSSASRKPAIRRHPMRSSSTHKGGGRSTPRSTRISSTAASRSSPRTRPASRACLARTLSNGSLHPRVYPALLLNRLHVRSPRRAAGMSLPCAPVGFWTHLGTRLASFRSCQVVTRRVWGLASV